VHTHPEMLHNSRQIWRFHSMRACHWRSCADGEKACREFYKFRPGRAVRTINLYSLDHKPHPQYWQTDSENRQMP